MKGKKIRKKKIKKDTDLILILYKEIYMDKYRIIKFDLFNFNFLI